MKHRGLSLFGGVGERTREGADLYYEMQDSSIIEISLLKKEGKHYPEPYGALFAAKGSHVVCVFGQMNETPGLQDLIYLSLLIMFSDLSKIEHITDPAPVVIFGHLDGITVLSRAAASKAIYPAVDPFNSTS